MSPENGETEKRGKGRCLVNKVTGIKKRGEGRIFLENEIKGMKGGGKIGFNTFFSFDVTSKFIKMLIFASLMISIKRNSFLLNISPRREFSNDTKNKAVSPEDI